MSKERKVWVIDLSDMCIFETALKTKSAKGQISHYVTQKSYGIEVIVCLECVEKELRNEEKYGWSWVVPTNTPRMHVASSESKCIDFLRSRIESNKQEIAMCDKLLELYEEDHHSIVNAVRAVVPVEVVAGEESSDNIHAGYFHTERVSDYTQMGLHIRSSIEKSIGVSLNQCPDAKITLSISRYYINFYIDRDTTRNIAMQYGAIEPVADKLDAVWRDNSRGFDINFVHKVPDEINHAFFRRGPQYIAGDFDYQELNTAIRRQLTSVITTSGRTRKNKKSKSNPIQFVLSPEAAKSIENMVDGKNNMVFEYSGEKNPMDNGRYYGLTKPLTVYCHGRPDGTIFLMSESLPENTISLSKEQYIECANRPTNILDTIIGY